MIEKYAHREQAESRAEYIRIGRYKNTYVEERDVVNRWTGAIEHCFVVVRAE